ncbi:hypothetical protein WH52_01880 [Tenacibaculum holothuriorum]|uniref:Alpha/beta hydrolase n=1 Tax=Tenacibaculum holothuriorum TaxID=1635173 RepID=A0A1Y2PHY5_9FLAO|nr:alpha/beta hydrolase [Tenacibaculum holothuriorum]OSY89407.1 hypothetical protein WH52_01880 [Tenacibaculum holothuriorum]
MNLLHSNKKFDASIKIPKFIQISAKVLQSISYKFLVRFADFLFTTPIGYPTPKREQTMEESAQKKSIFVPSINRNIHVLSYGYSKKKVLLVHGWAGRSTQLFMLADKLLEKGYMVISFDGPAHGKSDGKRTYMPEFMDTIIEITKEFGPFNAAIGHSFGGMSLINTLDKKEFNLECLVTIGAADSVTNVLTNFSKNLGVKPILAEKMQQFYEKNWSVKLNDYAPMNAAKNVKIPTLVVHDSEDGDVPVRASYNIRQNLQNGTLLVTHGFGHTKILRNNNVSNKIVKFITEHT